MMAKKSLEELQKEAQKKSKNNNKSIPSKEVKTEKKLKGAFRNFYFKNPKSLVFLDREHKILLDSLPTGITIGVGNTLEKILKEYAEMKKLPY